jgi:hypothetical protein
VSGTYTKSTAAFARAHLEPELLEAARDTVRWELESQIFMACTANLPTASAPAPWFESGTPDSPANVDACKSHGDGWVRVLSWMQQFVEEGKTIETR